MSDSQKPYASRHDSDRRWEDLARAIAEEAHQLSDKHYPSTGLKGRLVILGSGIEAVGFSIDCEAYIGAADEVFYCVADPVTQVWIRDCRPDAYDLYTLYDDRKPRYHTYMQMTEAMLHFVRKGKFVVAVYYGHPGIFALSTHRAIAIARREGHTAIMKPAVSALDCLCADLGVDPAYPGLQTFEATDMILRGPKPDLTLHVILWQVGVIGEMGYRRRGYLNSRFPVLLDYLDPYYGADYEIVHYIASRYPTLPPIAQRLTLRQLRDPRNQAAITGISTLYIPPKEGASSNVEASVQLGFSKPGQRPKAYPATRLIDAYGMREMKAIHEFASFKVPVDYQYQERTKAAEFMLALSNDLSLQDRYACDPRRAVSAHSFPGLSVWERRQLVSRDIGRVQIAIKRSYVQLSSAEQFVVDVLGNPALGKQLMQLLNDNYMLKTGLDTVNAWISSQGYPNTSIEDVINAAPNVTATMLLPWTAVYLGSDNATVLIVIGDSVNNANSQIYVNSTRIDQFTFNNGVLSWGPTSTNPSNGQLTFVMPQPTVGGTFTRSIQGSIWPAGSSQPPTDNISFSEVEWQGNPLITWVQQYSTTISGTSTAGPSITIGWNPPGSSPPGVYVEVDGQPVTGFSFTRNTLTWGANKVTFAMNPTTKGQRMLSGSVNGANIEGASDPAFTSAYQGQYKAWVLQSGQWVPITGVSFNGNVLEIDTTSISNPSVNNGQITWSGAGGPYDSGNLSFSLDSVLMQMPVFTGFVWPSGSSQPSRPNIKGSFNAFALMSWAGLYPTVVNGSDPGKPMTIQSALPPQLPSIIYGSNPVQHYNFSNRTLTAQVDSATSFTAEFRYTGKNSTRSFTGTLTQSGSGTPWNATAVTPGAANWVGYYNSSTSDARGIFTASPTAIQVQVSGSALTVTLSNGSGTMQVSGAVFDPQTGTLRWENNTGTPEGNRYANASILFADDPSTSTPVFFGLFWPTGSPVPSQFNWKGQLGAAPLPVNGSTIPGWAALLFVGIGAVSVFTAAFFGLRPSFRLMLNALQRYLRSMLCHQKVDERVTSGRVSAHRMTTAAGSGLNPCQDEDDDTEDEADETGDEMDEGDAANPGEIPDPVGADPAFDPPNTNVDTDVDVDVDTDVDVDFDIDIDVDIDVDIDADIDNVTDNVTDNVVDNVTDNVTIIQIGAPAEHEGEEK